MQFKDYVEPLRGLYKERDATLHLQRPAPQKGLAKVEAALGAPLDPDLRAAWSVANGGPEYTPVFARPGYLTGYDLFSAEDGLRERGYLAQRAASYGDYQQPEPRDPRIQPGWFQPGWLPFAGFGGGSLLLISDLSPAPAGQPGQIIGFVHDPDEIVYVASSFAEFLEASLQALTNDADELLLDL